MQQLLFGSQFRFGLRRDLADENVARLDAGPDADNSFLVEVAQGLLADVGDVTGELFAAQLGLANFDVELVDVDRRVDVIDHQSFGEDDRVLEVVPLPRHEGHERVAAQRKLTVAGTGAVAEDLAFLDALIDLHDRLLIEARPLVEAGEFPHRIALAVDFDDIRIDKRHLPGPLGPDDHPRVLGDGHFQPGADQGRFGDEQRDRLPLHVGTHQGAVGVVVLEEGNQPCGDADHLARRDVDEFNLFRIRPSGRRCGTGPARALRQSCPFRSACRPARRRRKPLRRPAAIRSRRSACRFRPCDTA